MASTKELLQEISNKLDRLPEPETETPEPEIETPAPKGTQPSDAPEDDDDLSDEDLEELNNLLKSKDDEIAKLKKQLAGMQTAGKSTDTKKSLKKYIK